MGREAPLPGTRPTPTHAVRGSLSRPASLLDGRTLNCEAQKSTYTATYLTNKMSHMKSALIRHLASPQGPPLGYYIPETSTVQGERAVEGAFLRAFVSLSCVLECSINQQSPRLASWGLISWFGARVSTVYVCETSPLKRYSDGPHRVRPINSQG